MKISTATVLGLLFGVVIGLIGMGKVNALGSGVEVTIHGYAWWIVVLSMLAPLADYLSGMRTTIVGFATGHPYRHLAGFFTGLAVALGFLLLLTPRLPAFSL